MRRHIPKEYKDLALHLSINLGIHDQDIRSYIGISPRAMRRLRKTYRESGETVPLPVMQGRPRLLDAIDATVSNLDISLSSTFLNLFVSFLKAALNDSPTCCL